MGFGFFGLLFVVFFLLHLLLGVRCVRSTHHRAVVGPREPALSAPGSATARGGWDRDRDRGRAGAGAGGGSEGRHDGPGRRFRLEVAVGINCRLISEALPLTVLSIVAEQHLVSFTYWLGNFGTVSPLVLQERGSKLRIPFIQ